MSNSEARLALLFAMGGIVCLGLAVVVSLGESREPRYRSVQRNAVEAIKQGAEKRIGKLASQLVPTLQEGDHGKLQSALSLLAHMLPELIEVGVVDMDMTVLGSSDPADVGKTLKGPPLQAVQGSLAGGDRFTVEDATAQRVMVAAPMVGDGPRGKRQRIATVYINLTTAEAEERLSYLHETPSRVPVWLIIGLGLIGLCTGVGLLWVSERRLISQAQHLHAAAEQIATGRYDARIDPAHVPLLGGVAERINAMAETVVMLQQAQLEGTMHRSRIDEEIQSAQVVQQTLMPDVRRIGRGPLQLCGVYRSVSKLSGDWWHYYPLDEHRTLLVLADVLGHGIGAAVVGAMAYGCAADIHLEMRESLRPDVLLRRLNAVIWSTTRGKYTMSCFAAILDTKECQLTYASGAHAFPLLHRSSDPQKPFVPLVAPGAPLGSSEAPEFTASTLPFGPGDLLICYTDGLIEAANAAGDPFGDKRVRHTVARCFKRTVEEICEILLAEVSRFVGSAELDDDQTLVVARNILAASSTSWQSPSNPG